MSALAFNLDPEEPTRPASGETGSNLGLIGSTGGCLHSVQFYEEDAVFLDGLARFVGGALGTGSACIAIATPAHLKGLAQRLRENGIDLRVAVQRNRYIPLDAARTLAKFMVDGWPDERRFFAVLEPKLRKAKLTLRGNDTSIAAFGEMVALLSAEGKCEAAIRLEQLWNKLACRYTFTLRCAYPMANFGAEEGVCFGRVCAEHQAVLPTESFTSLATEDARLRMVSSLQQKALTLQASVEAHKLEVAERKQLEVKLRQTEEFARKVVENTIDCVQVLDLDGRLEYISPPGQRALGIKDAGLHLGRRWADFWSVEDRPQAEAAIAAAKREGIGSFQGDCSTLGGIRKSWDVKITPALDSEGKMERLIVVSRDITKLKLAQTALIQAEKLAATGRLAATIAHEINNPLEAVINFIYLAKISHGVPEVVCRQLEVADRELARVAQIAQQTLGFYRDSTTHKWVGVSELIKDVVTLYEGKLRSKQLRVQIDADDALKIHLRQGELKQILVNLIANAIDASTGGGRLWLRVHPTKNWTNGMQAGLRITVADNGSGMSPEVQQRIFVPFFTTKADVGTGIGLWVTKSLIESQDGYLRFRSRQGPESGTVMSFFLPLTQKQDPNGIAVNEKTLPPGH